jgi:NAD/NADP transhydrogenase beta subunit
VHDVLGVLSVNGWHNVVHLLTGLLGLAVARSYSGSRAYAIGFGVLYTAVAIWGFVIGDGASILGFLPVNSEDNVLHLLIALAGIGAGLGTAATPRPSARDLDETSFRELKI